MPTYNKLVRDEIPKIIKENGSVPVVRKLKAKEYKKELCKKVVEEAKEICEAESKGELIEELADMQEVLSALYSVYKIECSEVTKTARKKRKERGAFDKKIFLEKVNKK